MSFYFEFLRKIEILRPVPQNPQYETRLTGSNTKDGVGTWYKVENNFSLNLCLNRHGVSGCEAIICDLASTHPFCSETLQESFLPWYGREENCR